MHLDFHTSEHIGGIGEKFDKQQFQAALKRGHVDSITLFSKCHHGWAYHPSTANEAHPNLGFDLLGAQIEAAHEIGVKTPVYLSAGLDEKLARQHPNWLLRKRDESLIWTSSFDKAGYHRFCMNSPYLNILLSQIAEVCERYDADGIFLDIVRVFPCYCQNCVSTLIREGKDPYDDGNIVELAERVWANYVRRVRETIDSVRPGLAVFHNGGYVRFGRRDLIFANTHMELESLPTGGWGYDHFPLCAAYVRTLGVDYLGMTGKFHKTWGEFGGFKHPNALKYECALSAAFGAGCSVGDQLTPNAKMDMATYDLIGSGYSEIELREPWLQNVSPIADIGLLSVDTVNLQTEVELGSLVNKHDVGAVRILLEGKYLFNVIDTEEDFSKYKVLILPDAIEANMQLREKLREYAEGGGKILASGISGMNHENNEFFLDFGAKPIGEQTFCPVYFRPNFAVGGMSNTAFVAYTRSCRVKGEKVHGIFEEPYFNRDVAHFCSHMHTPNSERYGGDAICEGNNGIYIAWNIFEDYAENGSFFLKHTVCYVLDALLRGKKTLETDLPAQGIATLQQQAAANRLVAHLLYAAPVKRGINTEVIEDIVPIYSIDVKMRTEENIKSIRLVPQNEQLPFSENGDEISFVVPELRCWQIVVAEY